MNEIIKNLPKRDLEAVMLAFEQGLQCLVEYKEGLFVGVNVTGTDKIIILETKGMWSHGAIKKG